MQCKLWQIKYYDSGWKTIYRGWSIMPEKMEDENSETLHKRTCKWFEALISVTDIPNDSVIILT